jgi:hypothetical protein
MGKNTVSSIVDIWDYPLILYVLWVPSCCVTMLAEPEKKSVEQIYFLEHFLLSDLSFCKAVQLE